MTAVKTIVRLVVSSVLGTALFVVLLFVPAGTFGYWQGWVFLVVFALSTWIPTIYLVRTDPAALKRRMRAGPFAEARIIQKIAVSISFASMAAMIVGSTLDHRFGWSSVPTAICVLGDALVAIGLSLSMLVVIQNSYAAATITVEDRQPVVSTGFYGIVRHPMYAAAVVMMVGIPLALGSYWGLVFVVPGVIVLVVRIRDEEQLLADELDGYREYTQRVRYRLLPRVW